MNKDKKLLLPCLIIAAAIVAVLLLGTLIVTERGSAGANVNWTLTAGGRLKATGEGEMDDFAFAKNNAAVFYHKSVVKATLAEGITRIGDEAFYDCYNMRSLSIPDSVTSIGGSAFHGCTKLGTIRLSENAAFTFENGGLYTKDGKTLLFVSPKKCGKAFTVPDGVEVIAEEAFYGCGKITTLTLPDSLNTIGAYAFHGCSNLVNITPGANFAFEDGALYNAEKTELIVLLPKAGKTEFNVPAGVEGIGDEVFYGCKTLTAVSLPDTVGYIGDGAFGGCTNLETVTLNGNAAYTFEDGALYTAERTTLLAYLPKTAAESFTVPESVVSIAPQAFYGCKNIETLILPGSIEEIGPFAFTNCSSLTALTFGGSESRWRAMLDGTHTGLVEHVVKVSF